ncbi:MAG: GtrA family protein [Deferrisomatales bacterium]|nr:GtrA family protein [Deferrisomatales bacterium]
MRQKWGRRPATVASRGIALELGRYLAASTNGTVVHYCLMLALVYLADVNAVTASTCGAVAGAAIIYVLNYYVTFKSANKHKVAALRFSMVAVLSVVLNGVILKGLLSLFDWHYMLLQVATTVFVFVFTYIINREWTF